METLGRPGLSVTLCKCALAQVSRWTWKAEYHTIKQSNPWTLPQVCHRLTFFSLCLACVSLRCSQSKYSVKINSSASKDKASLCISLMKSGHWRIWGSMVFWLHMFSSFQSIYKHTVDQDWVSGLKFQAEHDWFICTPFACSPSYIQWKEFVLFFIRHVSVLPHLYELRPTTDSFLITHPLCQEEEEKYNPDIFFTS